MRVRVKRRGGLWCEAKRKTTDTYQDSVAVKCGGYVIAPFELSMTADVTCPDCLAERQWCQP